MSTHRRGEFRIEQCTILLEDVQPSLVRDDLAVRAVEARCAFRRRELPFAHVICPFCLPIPCNGEDPIGDALLLLLLLLLPLFLRLQVFLIGGRWAPFYLPVHSLRCLKAPYQFVLLKRRKIWTRPPSHQFAQVFRSRHFLSS